MQSTYKYRVLKSTWGIAIDITAEIILFSDYSDHAEEVEPGIWLALKIRGKLTEEEKGYLANGVHFVSKELRTLSSEKDSFVIYISDLLFNPTDYQEEGLTYALAGWLAQEFHFNISLPVPLFDRSKNKYIFPISENSFLRSRPL